jgi:hypothetical protein
MNKMESLRKKPGIIHFKPFISAIISALNDRFGACVDEKDLCLAAIVHPKFKLTWIRDHTSTSVQPRHFKSNKNFSWRSINQPQTTLCWTSCRSPEGWWVNYTWSIASIKDHTVTFASIDQTRGSLPATPFNKINNKKKSNLTSWVQLLWTETESADQLATTQPSEQIKF